MKIFFYLSLITIFFGSQQNVNAQVAPGGVASPKLWLKANAGVLNASSNPAASGDAVATWDDQSTNGNNATSGSAPTYFYSAAQHVNYNPFVQFGATNVMNLSNLGLGGKTSVAFFGVSGINYLLNAQSNAISDIVQFFCPTGPGNLVNNFSGSAYGNANGSYAGFGTSSVAVNMGWRDAAGSMLAGINGKIISTKTDAQTHPYVSNNLQIGLDRSHTSSSSGPLTELIAYDRALSDSELLQVTSYLCIKYGSYMTADRNGNGTFGEVVAGTTDVREGDYLASNGAVIWRDPVAPATYRFYTTGIGRDDNSGLNQKQSQSTITSGPGKVAMGLGTIAATNAANTNSFTNDKSFLIWADNGSNTTINTAGTTFTFNGSSANKRMNRIWRVQNTGVYQTIAIQVPTSAVGVTTTPPDGTCTKYAIIYSTDPTFATGVTAAVLTTSGSNYTVSHKFPQGETYFTFAKLIQQAPGAVYLPMTNTTATFNSTCTNAPGWKYYYYDAAQTQKAFAINWNGNTEPGGINAVVTYNGGGAYTKTNAVTGKQCNIMGRLLEILPAGGSYTVNGGVKVRIFFDSTELMSSLVPSPLSQSWFKYSGDAAATIAANNGHTLPSANFYYNTVAGEEDGWDYVDFSGITSFSTFGFASNTGVNPLPVDIISFTGIKKETNKVNLNWVVENEFQFDRYEIEQSDDGLQYVKVGTIPSKGSSARSTYAVDVSFTAPLSYYRLKLLDKNGNYKYSTVIVIKSKTDQEQRITIHPNPVKGDKVLVELSGYKGNAVVKVYDQYGRMIIPAYTALGNGTVILNLQGISSGAYYIKAIDTKNNVVSNTEKLLLVH